MQQKNSSGVPLRLTSLATEIRVIGKLAAASGKAWVVLGSVIGAVVCPGCCAAVRTVLIIELMAVEADFLPAFNYPFNYPFNLTFTVLRFPTCVYCV